MISSFFSALSSKFVFVVNSEAPLLRCRTVTSGRIDYKKIKGPEVSLDSYLHVLY